ncbi:MAG: M15 family metallopeptidase [Treponema sp.]|nr:M15 family metallopeptidase [Treponema sp.]
MHKYAFLFLVIGFFVFQGACSRANSSGANRDAAPEPEQSLPPGPGQIIVVDPEDPLGQYLVERDPELIFDEFLQRILTESEIPPDFIRRVSSLAAEGPSFILDLLAAIEGDPYLRRLVDKQHPLPPDYEPEDLAELGGGSYELGRSGLLLRRAAAEALEEMAAAALAEGITLKVSSAYRSFAYQEEVYARNVREMGQEAADRESARPGYSQHQTGLVVDFGSIDDSFAQTAPGRWVLANASRFGWSLSFPQGYEEATGYRWESWHYRYVGRELAYFIDTYFDGIQQYALQFLQSWEAAEY